VLIGVILYLCYQKDDFVILIITYNDISSPRNIKMMNFSWLHLTFKRTCQVEIHHYDVSRNIKMMNFSWLHLTFKRTCQVVTSYQMSTGYMHDLKNIEVIHVGLPWQTLESEFELKN